MKRADLLIDAGCKVLVSFKINSNIINININQVLDSSHGACKPARDQIQRLKEKFGNKIELIVGQNSN